MLAGPPVRVSEPDRPTLIVWDYSGRLQRLDVSPEEAAVDLLDLDDATRESVLVIVSERAAVLDRVVIESLDLFQQFEVANSNDNGPAKAALIAELSRRLRPLLTRGMLFDEFYEVLPRDKAPQFAHMVDEYRRAAIEDARRQAEQEGRPFNALQAGLELRGQAFAQAIERSFARTTQAGEKEFEELLTRLDLSPEGEQIIRARATRFAEQTKLNPTKAQTLVFVLQVLSELEPAERIKVVRGVIEINREQKALEREMENQHRGQDSTQPMRGG